MLIERWLTAHRWVRYVSLIAINGVAFTLLHHFTVQPQETLIHKARQENTQQSQSVVHLRRELVSLTRANREAEKQLSDIRLQPFSLIALVSHGGGKLERWQPESKPAVLEMLLQWEQLPALFSSLAGYQDVVLQGFGIKPEGEWLRLTMTLGFHNEG